MFEFSRMTQQRFLGNSAVLAANTAVVSAAKLPQTGPSAARTDVTGKVEPAVFPYSAVYSRKSNPPKQDWARDHQTAARIGMNTFRHWFMWSVIEVAPGKYNWEDYDRMMDLAARNGIQVVIAEMITCAPEWAFDKYPNTRFLANDGFVINSMKQPASVPGGMVSVTVPRRGAAVLVLQ
jgi:beta-galactosidase